MSLWLAGYPKTLGFDVRFGSNADIDPLTSHVRFTPESGHYPTRSECLLWPNSSHPISASSAALAT
jgi:hypothetical protein